MNYYFWLGEDAETPIYMGIDFASGEDETALILSDGFGGYWQMCGTFCELEVVRPGKVQCDYCDTLCEFCGDNSVEFHLDPDPRWPSVAGWFCVHCGPYPQQNQ